MPKNRIHISLPSPIQASLEALARLEGRTVSDILEELARNELRSRDLLPAVTGKEIAAEVAKRGRKRR